MDTAKNVLSLFLLLIAFQLPGNCRTSPPVQPPNVLFICVDDLRPDLGCYGNPFVKSPNLDKLAARATQFTRHYVSMPACAPSRYSLLTGRRPREQSEWTMEVFAEKTAGRERTDRPESLVEHFRRNGYYTVGIGKISHSPDGYLYGYNDPKSDVRELPNSWDELPFNAGKWGTGWNAFFGYADGSNRQGKKEVVKPYEAADTDDEGYPDGLSAGLAVQKLRELAAKGQPFFLGLGFFKPHLPFNAPEKYWALYDRDELPLTATPALPANVNPASLHESGEFNRYKSGEEPAGLQRTVSGAYARKIKHAYYAAVSYVDAQIGKVLAELERSGLDKNTIVVVWSDHGWHLGDYGVWGKGTLFEQSLRSVLMVSGPGIQGGIKQDAILSTIDIYPTLLQLCGLPPVAETDGKSFVSLLKSPGDTEWENVAYSYWGKGISLRTDRYRYTRYFREEEPAEELFDHWNDPFETRNITGSEPGKVEALSEIWEKGNTRNKEEKK